MRCLTPMVGSLHILVAANADGRAFSTAGTLASYVGYGNVAGFLFNKGIMSAPPPPAGSSGASAPTTTSSGAAINPITGVMEKPAPPIEMTDEEKEREAKELEERREMEERERDLPGWTQRIRQEHEVSTFATCLAVDLAPLDRPWSPNSKTARGERQL